MEEIGGSRSYDILTPDPVEVRFGMSVVQYSPEHGEAVMRLPMAGMTNPITGAPTVGPLGLLADQVCSTAAWAVRGEGFPVSTELTLQVAPNALAAIGSAGHVTGEARVIEWTSSAVLVGCQLTAGAAFVASAALRSVLISGDVGIVPDPSETLIKHGAIGLADLLSLDVTSEGGSALRQRPDPMISNAIGHVHGGVAATCLELAASAQLWKAGDERPFRTGSWQVNYLRPFVAGPGSVYAATVVNIGSSMAVVDSRVAGANGKCAAVARLTAYR